MADPQRDPEMERVTDELATTLRDLRDELGEQPEPPRGPLGLPRPPTPRELLRFTDEFAVPAVIAVLEANIRMLEAFQGAVRLARAGDEAAERGREARARTEELSRGALDRLDEVLVDLQNALDGRPESPEARTLVDDARTLRREIDDRLRDADRRGSRDERDDAGRGRRRRGTDRDEASRPDDTDDSPEEVAIDVDSELDSIRESVEDENDDGDT